MNLLDSRSFKRRKQTIQTRSKGYRPSPKPACRLCLQMKMQRKQQGSPVAGKKGVVDAWHCMPYARNRHGWRCGRNSYSLYSLGPLSKGAVAGRVGLSTWTWVYLIRQPLRPTNQISRLGESDGPKGFSSLYGLACFTNTVDFHYQWLDPPIPMCHFQSVINKLISVAFQAL